MFSKHEKEEKEQGQMSFVIVKGDRISTEQVEFLNIEEDFDGADLMTFNYKGEQYTSRVYVCR
jgi:hypothetical protein